MNEEYESIDDVVVLIEKLDVHMKEIDETLGDIIDHMGLWNGGVRQKKRVEKVRMQIRDLVKILTVVKDDLDAELEKKLNVSFDSELE